jgi:hypothetical protein
MLLGGNLRISREYLMRYKDQQPRFVGLRFGNSFDRDENILLAKSRLGDLVEFDDI